MRKFNLLQQNWGILPNDWKSQTLTIASKCENCIALLTVHDSGTEQNKIIKIM